jgi:hypothetical protein
VEYNNGTTKKKIRFGSYLLQVPAWQISLSSSNTGISQTLTLYYRIVEEVVINCDASITKTHVCISKRDF